MHCNVVSSFDPRWDRFVADQSVATFFHQWKWRALLHDVFGYEPYYLAVEDGDQIAGILPLFLVRSALFGKSLVALPLAVYGGVVATSAEAESLVLEQAREIARQTRAKYLELRGNPYSESLPTAVLNETAASVKQKDLYFTFIAPIDSSDDANFAKIPRKQRRMIRQSQKSGKM